MRELTTDEMKMVSGGLRPPDAASANFALASAPMGGFDATPRPGFGYGSFGLGRNKFSNLSFFDGDPPPPPPPDPELPDPPDEIVVQFPPPPPPDEVDREQLRLTLQIINAAAHAGAAAALCGTITVSAPPIGAICFASFAGSGAFAAFGISKTLSDDGDDDESESKAPANPPSSDTGTQ